MTDATTENTLSPAELLIAEARAKANKPPRTKKATVLASIVEFYNGDNDVWMHVEQKYPTLSVSSLTKIVRENDALDGKVFPVQNDNYGLCLCKIS